MYSAFCRNLRNYLKQYDDPGTHHEYRYRVIEPFTLMLDADHFKAEKKNQTEKYKKVADFLEYAKIHINTAHQLPTLLRELEDYGITPQYQGVVSEEDLQEQLKIMNMFMKLMYY